MRQHSTCCPRARAVPAGALARPTAAAASRKGPPLRLRWLRGPRRGAWRTRRAARSTASASAHRRCPRRALEPRWLRRRARWPPRPATRSWRTRRTGPWAQWTSAGRCPAQRPRLRLRTRLPARRRRTSRAQPHHSTRRGCRCSCTPTPHGCHGLWWRRRTARGWPFAYCEPATRGRGALALCLL